MVREQPFNVIVITIACSDRMGNKANIWNELKDIIIEQFDGILKSDQAPHTVFCLNIHSNGEKVKSSKFDRITDNVWKDWINKFSYDS